MVKKYLKVSTIPGRWYVSEGWQSGMIDNVGQQLSKHEYGNQLGLFVLAGPFVTRGHAEIWNTQHADGHASVWQRD